MKNSLLAYAKLLRRHIQKEDNVLYPMADRVLTGQDQQALAEAFEKVEAQEISARASTRSTTGLRTNWRRGEHSAWTGPLAGGDNAMVR